MTRPTTTAPAHAANELALVKLMRGTGFAAVDLEAGDHVATVGDDRHPHGLAFGPDGRWVYGTFAGSGTVAVVDTRSLSVVDRTDAVGTAPIGIETSRNGRYVFVTGYGDLPDADEPGLTVLRTNVHAPGSVADGDADASPTLEPVVHRPIRKCAGVVVDATNDVWVALKDEHAVVRLDGRPPFEARDRIDVPEGPQDLAYAPEYGLLGVNSADDGSVAFVDVRERRMVGIVDAPNPRGGAVSVAHDRWFVGDTDGDGVTVVDVTDEPRWLERLSLGTATAFPDVTPDGAYAVFDAYDDDRVTFVDVADRSVEARVETGPAPRHPRFSADGHRCYVPNVDGDSLSILETAPLYEPGSAAPTVRETISLPADSAPSSCFLTARYPDH